MTTPPSKQLLPWGRADSIALALVTIVGALLRFVRLAQPGGFVFDETYYAKDACLYLRLGQFLCQTQQATEQSYVHPPLGKWLIAIGIKVFGYNEFGWRVMAAAFGTALVAITFLLARKLFRDRWIATVAGLLAASDFLLIVQSRIAMLDIFQAFFVALGFLFIVFDRERVLAIRDNALLPFPAPTPHREPEWRFAAGAAFGLALGVKWSSAWALAGAGLLAAYWSLSLVRTRLHARKQARSLHRETTSHPGRLPEEPPTGPSAMKIAAQEASVALLAMLVIPLFVYLTTFSKYFIDTAQPPPGTCSYTAPEVKDRRTRKPDGTVTGRIDLGVAPGECVEGVPGSILAFMDLHVQVADYHLFLKATHGYQSKAITWPIVKRPVAYFFEGEPKATHVLAMGNPGVWWPVIGAAIWLLVRSSIGMGFRAERVITVAWATQYLPWLLVARPLFLFYMTPAVPFMMIGLAAALRSLRSLGKPARWVVTAYLVIAVAILLYFFYPVIAAVGLPRPYWEDRMWLRSWI